MARTDDDSWDITESVGATALGIAQARASESECERPLFTDPYARLFIDAATARGWSSPLNDETIAELQKADPQLTERMQAMFGYAACRTKYFDEFFIAAGAAGIEQVVILAAGLDARAWRLPWVSDTVVYEIDQPKVLEFKSETLRANDAKPAIKYVAVPIDLRQDWPKALREAGFQPAEPTAWSAEGLLLYLPADAQDRLFERIQELSAQGSRIAVETFNSEFFDPERLDQRRARMQRMREAAARAGHEMADPEELWFPEERADVAEWLGEHGWQVTATEARELMTRYHREEADDIEEATPPSIFVDGQLAD
jgi:methyltransferase (TIGR00027 family)